MQVTAILMHAEEGGFVAYNSETGTTSQGETMEDAITNLTEAVELYLEEIPSKLNGTLAAPGVLVGPQKTAAEELFEARLAPPAFAKVN